MQKRRLTLRLKRELDSNTVSVRGLKKNKDPET